MTASDDDVVLRLPFPVACELEAYLAELVQLHANARPLPGEMADSAARVAVALRLLRAAILPDPEPRTNVVPLHRLPRRRRPR